MRPSGLYNPAPVACRPYDPRAPEVAHRPGDLIRGRVPEVEVEHIGSTSVPDCAGKGYVATRGCVTSTWRRSNES